MIGPFALLLYFTNGRISLARKRPSLWIGPDCCKGVCLGIKKSRDAKDLIDSLIPMGMIFGCAIGVIFGMFFKPSFLVFTVSLGTGIGYLFGVIAFGIYSKKGKS